MYVIGIYENGVGLTAQTAKMLSEDEIITGNRGQDAVFCLDDLHGICLVPQRSLALSLL
jgi:hypothetical protein